MTWARCNKHPNAHRHEACPGCRDEQIHTFKRDLFDAVMDVLPGPMRILLRSKVTHIVQIIAEVVR